MKQITRLSIFLIWLGVILEACWCTVGIQSTQSAQSLHDTNLYLSSFGERSTSIQVNFAQEMSDDPSLYLVTFSGIVMESNVFRLELNITSINRQSATVDVKVGHNCQLSKIILSMLSISYGK